MEKYIKALSYQKKSVGKRIKSSKKLHIWTFSYKTQIFSIQLYDSNFSGKKTLKVNEEIRYSGKNLIKDPVFINKDLGVLIRFNGKSFSLIINGVPYERLKKACDIEIPVIIINDISDWESKAKPFGPIKAHGLRERFPLKKKELLGNFSLNHLNVTLPKPRSSSHKTDTLKSIGIDLLS